MIYNAISLVLTKNNEGGNFIEGQNSTGYCLVLNLRPKGLAFVPKAKKLVVFDDSPVFDGYKDLFKNIQPDAKGNRTLPVKDTAFPEELKTIPGGVDITVKLDGLYYRTYTANVMGKNQDGSTRIVHAKGTLICDQNGTPETYDRISVFCIQYTDEESGKIQYPFGDPVDIAKRMVRNGGYQKVTVDAMQQDTAAPAEAPEQVVEMPATEEPAGVTSPAEPAAGNNDLGF